jgi:spore germination protein YaaH
MLDHVSVPLLPSLQARMLRGGCRPIGLVIAIALAASASLTVTSAGDAYAADPVAGTTPSIQYQEALAYGAKTYSFAPGGPVTVPFRPRLGDSAMVDGALPVALPAGQGSGGVAPNLTAPASATPNGTVNLLRREVLGFLPYWELGSTLNYDTLSTIAYFGVGLSVDMNGTDPANDGSLYRAGSGWYGWNGATMTSVINNAHAHGTRVALTIESFAWDSAGAAAQTHLLSTPAASLRAAQQIAAEVGRRGADGVNLDFEPIAPHQSANYVAFVRTVRAELDKIHPGYELTFCATGRPNTYDLANLTAPGAADAAFIMGYDFRGGSPATTGSIDPLVSPSVYDLTNAVDAFRAQAPASKIILGLPWYGHAWSTWGRNDLNAPPADPTIYGRPASVPYSTAAGLAAMTDSTHLGKLYDTHEQTAWTAYLGNYTTDGVQMGQLSWRELYFDDAQALSAKLDAIDGWNLRGAGIWALGYDNNNGNGDLTNAIAAKLGVQGATYVPLSPTRILDTRSAIGLSGAFSSHIARTFQVTGRGGVPARATAVTGNLTVTQQSSLGYLYVGPIAMNDPTSSTLNFPMNDDRANAVTVALSAGGGLAVTYAAPTPGPTAQVIFDVTGYFMPDASGATYHPLTPTRILDSRDGTGGLSGKFSSHVARTFGVTGHGRVPSNATAVTGNLTVTQQSSLGYLFMGPVAMNNPTSSTLNFPMNDDRANAITVALGTGGKLSITYAAPALGPTAHVIFDVTGYFTPDMTGAKYVPLTPARVLATPSGTGLSGTFSSHIARTFLVAGNGGAPASATAVTGNLTVTQQSSLGYLFMGPVAMNNPTSSTLNFPMNDDRANAVTVALGTGGKLSVTYAAPVLGPTTHVIFDLTGYFAP